MKKLQEVINVEAFKHQRKGIVYMLNHHYSINGDDMGLGKSLQLIATALILDAKTIISCPTYLQYNWKKEIEKFSKEKKKVYLLNSKFDMVPDDWDFVIIPYSRYSSGVMKGHGEKFRVLQSLFKQADLVGVDEIQYLKNMKAKRTKLFHRLLKESEVERFVGLSGTVIENRVTEWYSPLVMLSYTPKKTNGYDTTYFFPNQFKFNHKFCRSTAFKVNGKIIRKWHGIQNKKMLKQLLKSKYVRRRTEEAIDLPDLIHKDVHFDIDGFPEDILNLWEIHIAQGKAKHIMSRKADSAYLKAQYTAEYVKGIIEDGHGPVVVFTDHLNSIQKIAVELKGHGLNGVTIQGSTNSERRQEHVDKFQSGELDYILLTIGAGSTGITLTKAKHMVFNDLSWVPAKNAQAEKRIHRIGQEHKCLIHRILGSPEDAMICAQLDEKMSVLKQAL